MTSLVFYEKPGCLSNAKQKDLLRAHGHHLDVRDLLAEAWTPERLRPFFGDRPVADWLNPTAPRVKAGEIRPQALDEAAALALMVADPILIRRPLIETEAGRCFGFTAHPLLQGLGVDLNQAQGLAACSKSGPDPHCAPPGGG